MITFFDLETTHLDPCYAEIITAFFLTEEGGNEVDSLEVKIKPNRWEEEAEKIHGISYKESQSFQDKTEGIKTILKYLVEHPGQYVCHANHNNFFNGVFQKYYYDWAVITYECRRRSSEALFWFYRTISDNPSYRITSTHTMAKEHGIKGGLSLNKLCDRIGYTFKHHDSKEDVYACRAIYNYLNNDFLLKANA